MMRLYKPYRPAPFVRMLLTTLLAVSVGLSLPPAGARDLSEQELSAVRDLVQEQYESLDRNMVTLSYQTRNELTRADDEDLIEVTTVHPDRPVGEKERLESVNGKPPNTRDERRFRRRPQPDERDEQPFRLVIDYDSLTVKSRDGDVVTLDFQPRLLVNGTPDEDGAKFQGSLMVDLGTRTLIRVEMELDESFSKMLFNISAFTVSETFIWHNDLLVREHYFHDLNIHNRLVNLSNQSSITFDYEAEVRVH